MHYNAKNNIEEMQIQVFPMNYQEFCDETGKKNA